MKIVRIQNLQQTDQKHELNIPISHAKLLFTFNLPVYTGANTFMSYKYDLRS